MTTLQRMQNSIHTAAVNTQVAIADSAQKAKVWFNRSIAPHSSTIAIATASVAAAAISALVLRNILINSNETTTPPSPETPLPLWEDTTPTCNYYRNNKFVLVLTDAYAKCTKQVVDSVNGFVNNLSNQDVYGLQDPYSDNLNNTLTNSLNTANNTNKSNTNEFLNSNEKTIPNSLNDDVTTNSSSSKADPDSTSNTSSNTTTEETCSSCTWFVDALTCEAVESVRRWMTANNISVESAQNYAREKTSQAQLWIQEFATKNNISFAAAQNYAQEKMSQAQLWIQEFATKNNISFAAAQEKILKAQQSIEEFAEKNNISVELAYEKLEAASLVSTATVGTYYTILPLATAVRSALLTTTQLQTVAQPYLNYIQALLNLVKNEKITSMDQLKNIISLMNELKDSNLLDNNLKIILQNYKNCLNAVTKGERQFQSSDVVQRNIKSIAIGLYSLVALKLTDINGKVQSLTSATRFKEVKTLLNTLSSLITDIYSHKVKPAPSSAAAYIGAVASAVVAVTSIYFTGMVKVN